MKKTVSIIILATLLIALSSCNILSATEEKTTCDGHEFRTTVTGTATYCSIVKNCTKCGYQEAREHNVSKNLEFTRIGDTETASVSIGTCTDMEVYIPAKVDIDGTTCTVTEIGLFMEGKFFEVYIPTTVTKIDTAAFMGCYNLVEVDIPDSVTELGEAVFSSCYGLDVANLPSNLTTLPAGLFSDAHGLKKVTPASVVCNENYDAFTNCYYFIAKNGLKAE